MGGILRFVNLVWKIGKMFKFVVLALQIVDDDQGIAALASEWSLLYRWPVPIKVE